MSSKRALKLIMLLPLIGMLLSCDVFLTPKLGRWNTKDPNAELEPYNRILKPKEDTWVDPSMKDISSLERGSPRACPWHPLKFKLRLT